MAERQAPLASTIQRRAVLARLPLARELDGRLYDCDFNQMLDLEVARDAPRHIRDFDLATLARRPIVVGRHCFGCTAGAGSSRGGRYKK